MPQPDEIVRASEVDLVDDDYPTEKRQLVAEYIEENWNDAGGLKLTQIAEETATSRQHVKNTLVDHFEIAGGEQASENGDDVSVPEESMMRLILEAYRLGYQDAQADSRQRESDIERLLDQLR